MNISKPRVVDLFAGAGLFSHAFKSAGFNVVRAIELDATAAATYAQNLGNHVEVGDVAGKKSTGDCDVIIAGPPCQGFSTLGKRDATDARNSLGLQVVRWARALKPKIVVIENVIGFLGSTHWKQVVSRFERLNYSITSMVLNAFDFGCAQHRRRSFTIAACDGIEISEPRKRRNIRSVRDAWTGLTPRPNGKNHHFAPVPSPLALARMKVIPPGGDKRNVMRKAPHLTPPSWWRLSCEVTDAWGRMEWDKPCNTLRTALQNASKGRYIHPEQHRVISLREAARLHSIPDNWTFAGLPTQISRQIGNSVPPALGRAIARSVLRGLN